MLRLAHQQRTQAGDGCDGGFVWQGAGVSQLAIGHAPQLEHAALAPAEDHIAICAQAAYRSWTAAQGYGQTGSQVQETLTNHAYRNG